MSYCHWFPYILKKEGISPFCGATDIPVFGLLATSVLGFKARVDTFACLLCCLHTMDSSDSPLVQHLLTSWWLVWQPSCFIYVLAYNHWWSLNLGSSVPLPHNMWQDRRSTDWATPAQLPYMIWQKSYVPYQHSWNDKNNDILFCFHDTNTNCLVCNSKYGTPLTHAKHHQKTSPANSIWASALWFDICLLLWIVFNIKSCNVQCFCAVLPVTSQEPWCVPILPYQLNNPLCH